MRYVATTTGFGSHLPGGDRQVRSRTEMTMQHKTTGGFNG